MKGDKEALVVMRTSYDEIINAATHSRATPDIFNTMSKCPVISSLDCAHADCSARIIVTSKFVNLTEALKCYPIWLGSYILVFNL